jgi:hypothetical protein
MPECAGRNSWRRLSSSAWETRTTLVLLTRLGLIDGRSGEVGIGTIRSSARTLLQRSERAAIDRAGRG